MKIGITARQWRRIMADEITDNSVQIMLMKAKITVLEDKIRELNQAVSTSVSP